MLGAMEVFIAMAWSSSSIVSQDFSVGLVDLRNSVLFLFEFGKSTLNTEEVLKAWNDVPCLDRSSTWRAKRKTIMTTRAKQMAMVAVKMVGSYSVEEKMQCQARFGELLGFNFARMETQRK